MNFKSIIKKTIAIGAFASIVVNCHPDKIEDDPLLFALAANTITGLASGNCAISVNAVGVAYGSLQQIAISWDIGGNPLNLIGIADTTWLNHYNNVNSTSVTTTTLRTEPYNKKFDTFFTDKDSWNDTARAAYLNTVRINATVSAALANSFGASGTAVLACARVPRSQCSLTGTTTANRAADITAQAAVYNAIQNNESCKKTNQINNTLLINLFRGDHTGSAITLSGGSFTNPTSNTDTASVGTRQSILGEKAYPKFGSLVALGFGQIMPLRESIDAVYSLSASNFSQGSNIGYKNIVSCESLNIRGTGITANGTTPLTNTKEVAYALSTNGSAASAYNTAVGNASAAYVATQAGEDAKICNNSFREKSPPSIALGGGKLGDVSGGAGDGGQSVLLTTCVYGKDLTARNTFRTAYNTTALNGVTDCPSEALTGATKFNDSGLETLSNFPNN